MIVSATATVVIPVYNDNANLERCLTALAASTGQGFSVLVVDDGSTEPVEPLVTSFGYQSLRITGPGGPARARNRGVQHVETDLLVFIDADVCVHGDTIDRFIRYFSQHPDVAAVVGSYDNTPAHPGLISQYRNLLHHYTHQQGGGEITTFWTGCGAIRKTVFTDSGGFDEKRYPRPMIEDIELGTWLTADGYRIVLEPTIQCTHLKHWSLWNMIKTDLFQRGIVWVDLMLRSAKVVKNLNVTWSQRISVALVGLAGMALLLGVWLPESLVVAIVMLVGVTSINRAFYRYLYRQRGLWFTIQSIPLHWLYLVCCGVSIVAGVAKYSLSKKN
jgi:cellulose synthase/poly-beta-1,6-N-acetylglucosamine synthase-like glycosyltransferase